METQNIEKPSIRKQTITSAFFVSLIALIIIIPIVALILMREFSNIETIYAKENVNRATKSLNYILSSYDRKLSDWAEWDDSYQYVADLNKKYETSNLNQTTLANLQVEEMFFIDSRGKLVKAVGSDAVIAKEKDFPEDAAKSFEAGSSVWNRLKTQESATGLIETEDGFLMFAARNILKSDGTGPSRGILVFGRYVGEWLPQDISNLIQLPVSPNIDYVIHDTTLPITQSGKDLIGHFWIPVGEKESGIEYEIKMPRDIWNAGMNSIILISVVAILIILITGIGNYFSIYKTILVDLLSFNKEISEVVAANGNKMLPETGNSYELNLLRKNINYLLGVLNKSKQEKEETINNMAKINSLMVGRELRMVELKKELNKEEVNIK